ncbi:hypothetical protein OSH11_11815 [Kaistia dalseonensis]|uniref:Uncharacterized protein n=1 Tax=Kaistia dalseonensis TaxID=410840 RepID=A0ABU0H7W6_9HYPH|nr:hypothetical protein [Kaistia dalseonensis]MCX5495395.1 hypothetical protein [Kaistia dalseonensis]MDQ0437983.1 hypothetical protein [Kaistia dalseonensis]
MTKVSLSRQIQAVDVARRRMNGGPAPRQAEATMIAADLDAVGTTLRWLQANEEAIRKIKAEQGDAA